MSSNSNNNSEKVYGHVDPVWFAPLNVIFHYGAHLERLPIEQKKSKAFRKADEMLASAIMLLGIQVAEMEEYWMQTVSDTEQSPDVRTGKWVSVTNNRAPDFQMQDVEVVSFVPEKDETLGMFLKRTKLSGQRAYDAKTTILCHMLTGAPTPTRAIARELRDTGAVCPVMVLGRTHPTEKKYALLQVFPQYKIIAAYDVVELLRKQTHAGVLNLKRGSRPSNEYRPEEKQCPFHSVGFDCPVIEAARSAS